MTKIVREVFGDELNLLADIEASSDLLFSESGIDLPTMPLSTKYEEAKVVIGVGSPMKGFVQLNEVDSNAHIDQLSVRRAYMGRGIGSLLLDSACSWAKDQNYNKITLITFRKLRWNELFYAKHGFKEAKEIGPDILEIRRLENEIGLDNAGDRIVMELNLIN